MKTIQADPLIGKIPAVQAGAVATLVDSTPLAAMANPSPLSIPWGIDDYFAPDGRRSREGRELRTHQSEAARVTWVGLALALMALAAMASIALRRSCRRVARLLGGLGHAFTGESGSIAAGGRREARPAHPAGPGRRGRARPVGCGDAGRHPQPAGRPGHPGRHHRRLAHGRGGHRVLRPASPTGYVWLAISRRRRSPPFFVYAVGSLGRGGATPLKLTLAGAATSAAFSSLISAILLPRIDVMNQFRFWQIGGVGGAHVRVARPGAAVPGRRHGALPGRRSRPQLAGPGRRRRRRPGSARRPDPAARCGRRRASCAARSPRWPGPIAFVGLVVPHLCRLLIGIDHRWLLPTR